MLLRMNSKFIHNPLYFIFIFGFFYVLLHLFLLPDAGITANTKMDLCDTCYTVLLTGRLNVLFSGK